MHSPFSAYNRGAWRAWLLSTSGQQAILALDEVDRQDALRSPRAEYLAATRLQREVEAVHNELLARSRSTYGR
jgi:hypothetical protein